MFKILLMVVGLLAGYAHAADGAIGYVKTVTGEASITRDGNQAKADIGSPVHQGSVLQTGPNSSLGVTFNDETRMSFGPDTVFTVDAFAYAPSQGKLKLSSQLFRGSLNYVSGVIAKLQPDAVSVKTPSGVIGVRGTQFLVRVEE